MKKIVSLILAVALIAALAISASAATVVVHNQCDWCIQNMIEHFHCPFTQVGDVAASSQMVRITEAPEDMALTWTTCAQALTIAEGKAICNDHDDLNNLTVFYQRNVVTAGGTMTVRLWPCNPAKLSNQSVVVLYRPVGGVWEVLGNQFGQKDITVELPAGEGAFAVCLGW